MKEFGYTWRNMKLDYWDQMWRGMQGPMVEAVLAHAAQASSLLEIGSGKGLLVQELHRRGWRGRYIGIDIAPHAVAAAAQLGLPDATFHAAHFLDWIAGTKERVDLAIETCVCIHQPHWMPIALAMRRVAPRVVMGVAYTSEADHHRAVWQVGGYYDVTYSLPLMAREAQAVGIALSIERFPYRPGRPTPEAVVRLSR